MRCISIRRDTREFVPEDNNFVYLTIEVSRGSSRHEMTKERDKSHLIVFVTRRDMNVNVNAYRVSKTNNTFRINR